MRIAAAIRAEGSAVRRLRRMASLVPLLLGPLACASDLPPPGLLAPEGAKARHQAWLKELLGEVGEGLRGILPGFPVDERVGLVRHLAHVEGLCRRVCNPHLCQKFRTQ